MSKYQIGDRLIITKFKLLKGLIITIVGGQEGNWEVNFSDDLFYKTFDGYQTEWFDKNTALDESWRVQQLLKDYEV
jgi:hypothetical protein